MDISIDSYSDGTLQNNKKSAEEIIKAGLTPLFPLKPFFIFPESWKVRFTPRTHRSPFRWSWPLLGARVAEPLGHWSWFSAASPWRTGRGPRQTRVWWETGGQPGTGICRVRTFGSNSNSHFHSCCCFKGLLVLHVGHWYEQSHHKSYIQSLLLKLAYYKYYYGFHFALAKLQGA